MDPREKEIGVLEREIKDLETKLQDEMVEMGKLVTAAAQARTVEKLAKYVTNVQTLQKSLEDLQRDISAIQATVARQQDLAARLAEATKKLKQAQTEYEQKAFDVGAGAYSVYKQLDNKAPYQQHFQEIARLDLEIERLQKEITALNEEEKGKGFLGKVVSKGKVMFLRSSVNKQSKQKLERFAEVGKTIITTDLVQHCSGELRYLFELMTQRKTEIETTTQEIAKLKSDQEAAAVELRKLGAEIDHRARIKELEKRIGDTRKELAMVYFWAGQAFVEGDSKDHLNDAALQGKSSLIFGLRGAIDEKRKRVDRLRVQIELDELEDQERTQARKKEQLESEIKTREVQIKSIDSELERTRKRIEELRRKL